MEKVKYLTFPKFIPKVNKGKDFSALEDTIKETQVYKNEIRNAECMFIRGSILNSYEGFIIKNHKNSDIDLVKVSGEKNRRINQYYETFGTPRGLIKISVDSTNLNSPRLAAENNSFGEKGVTSMSDIVQDTHCLYNHKFYEMIRYCSLFSYLRMGLAYYNGTDGVTPSGAMKAVQQARLIINPLRWWSIEFAYKQSRTHEENKFKYYADIKKMLELFLKPVDRLDDEIVYKIPDNLEMKANTSLIKLLYLRDKLIGRLHSNPVFSLNDFNKLYNKAGSLFIGIIKRRTNIDRIMQD